MAASVADRHCFVNKNVINTNRAALCGQGPSDDFRSGGARINPDGFIKAASDQACACRTAVQGAHIAAWVCGQLFHYL